MSKHPYPAHVQTAVAQALYEFECNPSGYDNAQEYYNDSTDAVLQAIWDASRVETFDYLEVLITDHWHEDLTLVDARGSAWPAEDYELIPVGGYPVHVIYWGDSDA